MRSAWLLWMCNFKSAVWAYWLCTSFTFVIFVAFMNSWDVSLFKWDEQENDLPQNSHFYFWRFHELQECLYALHECLGCVSTENTNRFVICIRNFGKIKAKIFYMHFPEIFESYNKYRFGKFPLLAACFPLLRKKEEEWRATKLVLFSPNEPAFIWMAPYSTYIP